jgi:ketol-acid reductoisomerase
MGAQRQSDLELRVKVLAKALGGEREGVVQARAEHECIADLISEQMVLCGGLPMLMAKTMEWMVAQGIPQRLAWVECVYEARMMAEMYESQGLLKTFKKISPAAATGGLETAKMMESQIEKWIGERAAHLAPKIDTSRERSFPESWKHADESKPC